MIKYIQRGYLVFDKPANIRNYIDYFTVPKGLTDVRAVFNGTSCGLNAATWSVGGSTLYLFELSELGRDLHAGRGALNNYLGSSYQGWDNGSALMFYGGLTVRWKEMDFSLI